MVHGSGAMTQIQSRRRITLSSWNLGRLLFGDYAAVMERRYMESSTRFRSLLSAALLVSRIPSEWAVIEEIGEEKLE